MLWSPCDTSIAISDVVLLPTDNILPNSEISDFFGTLLNSRTWDYSTNEGISFFFSQKFLIGYIPKLRTEDKRLTIKYLN